MVMNELRYTLLTDGTSDDALKPLLNWILREQGLASAIESDWADLRRVNPRPGTFPDRIRRALDLYPCDLLFVHRDAERERPEHRRAEIEEALKVVSGTMPIPPYVCVIPVRMMESWLLFDEPTIRRAAGNPKGKVKLALPRKNEIEKVPDPKTTLYEILRTASELNGRRLRNFSTLGSARRVADLLDDFSPLRGLSAFDALEEEIQGLVEANGWNMPDP